MPFPESAAIPYEALNLRGERLLVLAPHPDDEVIGCGGLVALHLQERRPVRVIVATDGREAGDAATRQNESRRALQTLGDAELEFLGFHDRTLDDELRTRVAEEPRNLFDRLREILLQFKPDLIAVPSALEIHPDHLALSRAFCDLIASDASLFADLAVARVAFYEVSHPLRPNALVDITAVADAKYAAIAMHESQLALRDYVAYARGLNSYRAMTLPPGVKFAEAYWVTPLPALRTMPFSAVRSAMGAPPPIDVVAEVKPISVIVRTKDRPALLREAIDSIRATHYPAQIVIVNDGGSVAAVAEVTEGRPAGEASAATRIIHHETSRGRSEAANSGARAATTPFIAFLDDDDLVHPEHFATLAAAAAPCYSDAVSAFVRGGETHTRLRIFSHDFDRELLLIDNYIPLPTILIPRDDFLGLGGFDPAFDLFEDWDFLIRLSQRHAFTHVPRITCEIRHIEGSGSIIVENPAGSQRFRDAKLQLWSKHAALMTPDVIANVFEREKQRTLRIESEVAELKGLRGHLDENAARLEREKASLIAEIQALQERINEAAIRISNLDGHREELRTALGLAQSERNELLIRVAQLGEVRTALDDTRGAYEESQRTISVLYAEIARLQTMLDSIFQSRTWKLHEIVQRVKGRG